MTSRSFIVNLAPTGMVPMRADSPHVPLSVDEIVADASVCFAAGASMIHLHARNADGMPTQDKGLMSEIVLGIRACCPGVVITVTTSGRLVRDVEERAACLYLDGDAAPDMASLTLGSMNFMHAASVNAPATIQRLAQIMLERGVKPELEVFDLGMLNYAHHLIDKGLLQPPFYFNILLGNIATAQTRLAHLATMLADLPGQSTVCLAGLGRYRLEATALASVVADGARVGLEDSLYLDADKQQAASNVMLVKRAVAQAQLMGRRVAAPGEVRSRLGLRPLAIA